MKLDPRDLSLYLVTDRTWLGNRTLDVVVARALENGVSFLQLREKNISYQDFKDLAITIKDLAGRYNIPFVINDNVDLAKEIDAGGVHIGQEDMSCSRARSILGDEKIIGVSVANLKEAVKAEEEGADYLGVGSIFPTKTKDIDSLVDLETIREITRRITIPIVGIGGINSSNIKDLEESGLNGVAVISSILGSDNIGRASRELASLVSRIFNK